MELKRVYVDRLESGSDIQQKMQEALTWVGEVIKPGNRVFIKPNFTYPFYKPGVTTSPALIEAVVSLLTKKGAVVSIGESDGGFHAWRAEEAFAGHHVPEICARCGVQVVNLSRLPAEVVATEVAGQKIHVKLPSMLLHEVDVFVTMPVPKVHVMTGVSLGFKNQWGCIPDVKRLRYHPDFGHVVLAVNKLLQPKLAVFDGTYFLNRTGPMAGDPVRMNLLITSNDPGAASLVCCEVMGIDPNRIGHLRLAMQEGMMQRSLAEVKVNIDPLQFYHEKFVLERTLMNWVALAAFHSKLATWLLYDSKFAKPIHDLVYLIRGRPEDTNPQW